MEPKKPTKQTVSERMRAAKIRKRGIIRRPARGYHRFRNGILNVAPKGAERSCKQLSLGGKSKTLSDASLLTSSRRVQENQESPLLRLPSEIRDCIWKYALGGKAFLATTFVGKYSETYKFAPSVEESSNGMALIRTCRQIYSETALYPLNLATFACDDILTLRRSVKILKTYQRKQVMQLRMAWAKHNANWWLWLHNLDFKKTFPALARITVLIHRVTDEDYDQLQPEVNEIRRFFRKTSKDTGCDLVVQDTAEEIESDQENQA